jgi:hypothetical protein
VRMLALARAHTAKVEPQHHCARLPQAARQPENHFIVHGPAVQRMRMANQRGESRFSLFRFFQQRFQPARRTRHEMRLDPPRHC